MWEYNHYDELIHYGILGMKWGRRRSDAQLAKARRSKKAPPDEHEDYKKAHNSKSVKSMSDKELRERNNRLQMEKQYSDLTKTASKGKKIVSSTLAIVGTATTIATAYSNIKKFKNSDLAKDTTKTLGKVGMKVIQKSPNSVKAKVAGVAIAKEISKFKP